MPSGSIRRRVGVRGTTYQVIIERGRKPDGSRWQQTKTFKRRKDAQDYLTKTLHELNAGVYITPSTMTLDEFAAHWFDTITVRQSSLVRYRSVYQNHIRPTFGSQTLGDITTTDIQSWFNEKRRRFQSAGSMLVQLNAILTLAANQKLILDNPCDGVDRSKERTRAAKSSRIKVWTPAQLATFLDLTRGHPDWSAWWVAAHTGVRPGELVALRWSDVDLTARTIHIERTQTQIDAAGHRVIGEYAKNEDSERTIGIDAETVMVLNGQRAAQNERRLALGSLWQDDNLVFDQGDGRSHSAHLLSQRFARRAVYYGLPRLSLHGVRHSWASHAAALGVPLTVIQRVLGHGTYSTTAAFYVHHGPDDHQAAIQAVADTVRRAREG